MKWSNSLAYAIGLITTDGSLSKDGRHLNLTSKDLDQIKTFSKIFNLKNKIGVKRSGYTKLRKYYFIQFGNVALYKFLMSLGLHPNKSKTLGELRIPNRYFSHFLRGYLDGDGYTYAYWDKRWTSSFRFYTGFVSASKMHLEWIKKRTYELYGLRGRIKKGARTYQLMYAKRNSIALQKIMYKGKEIVYLKRKKTKIDATIQIIEKQAKEHKFK
ncbi:MAG TPA: hypothetical protein VJ246_02910 [Patescibacteria group bacterium]|nr:hypothetical protein [Patescibacteria group bacterium]